MKEIFFVCGYPRSRHAWLATLLTWGQSFCFHDGLADVESIDQFDHKLQSVPGTMVGNSDPANLLFHVELRNRYPETKWIVIRRNPMESKGSWKLASGKDYDFTEYAMAMDDIYDNANALMIDYPKLSNINQLRLIVDWLNIEMPDERIEQLMRLNIQVQPYLLRNIPESTIIKMEKLHESILA